jgi:hypothetical protein
VRRSHLALGFLAGLLLSTGGTVLAEDASVQLSAIGFIGGIATNVTAGGGYERNSVCDVGDQGIVGTADISTYRCAFEFSLPNVPTGWTVKNATLQLKANIPPLTSVTVGGYFGNGTLEVADLTAGGLAVGSFIPNSATPETHDVTAFIAALVAGGSQWAGFNLAGDATAGGPGANSALTIDSPSDTNPPVLAVTYTGGGPGASAAATTPIAGGPASNTASSGSLVPIVLAIAAILVVAWLVRGQRRRSRR